MNLFVGKHFNAPNEIHHVKLSDHIISKTTGKKLGQIKQNLTNFLQPKIFTVQHQNVYEPI